MKGYVACTLAGKVGARNKGNPPTIEVGSQYTSKTCCKCLGHLWSWKKRRRRRFGECMLIQNRDRTGASNIGTQFKKLFKGEGTIHSMSDEEREFLRLESCFECTGA
jgi:transposase